MVVSPLTLGLEGGTPDWWHAHVHFYTCPVYYIQPLLVSPLQDERKRLDDDLKEAGLSFLDRFVGAMPLIFAYYLYYLQELKYDTIRNFKREEHMSVAKVGCGLALCTFLVPICLFWFACLDLPPPLALPSTTSTPRRNHFIAYTHCFEQRFEWVYMHL